MRAQGPEALDRLLVEYDAASPDEQRRLAPIVDEVAGQRYATVSRLFWHTDLDAAQAASRASGKPILSLRMLGRLDEDRSCANSRFFRVALYANAELSAWLRDTFVLHWSSARDVPKLTIDYGDGRSIETTVAGNSAHWVLDAEGRVLDVVPGLMTPAAFRSELEGAVALARQIAAEPSDSARRDRLLAAHHGARAAAIAKDWSAIAALGVVVGTPTLADAERRTISKMVVEAPPVIRAKLGPSPDSVAAGSEVWEPIGRQVLAARGLASGSILDASSRALMAKLRPIDWRTGEPLDDAGHRALAQSFERSIVADTGINLTQLRARIHSELAMRATRGVDHDFATLDAWLYADVFLTPASDPWLGLGTPGIFTGLPNDGVTHKG